MRRFDVVFDGSKAKLTLTTAPGAPATHWQQMRCLFQEPLRVKDGDCLVGKVTLRATRQQSYAAHGDIWCPSLPFAPAASLITIPLLSFQRGAQGRGAAHNSGQLQGGWATYFLTCVFAVAAKHPHQCS